MEFTSDCMKNEAISTLKISIEVSAGFSSLHSLDDPNLLVESSAKLYARQPLSLNSPGHCLGGGGRLNPTIQSPGR